MATAITIRTAVARTKAAIAKVAIASVENQSRCCKARSELKSPVDIYISLGSNIEPESNLAHARNALLAWLDDGRMSPVYQSAPVGMSGADFLNAVVVGSTTQSLPKVLDKLLEIELARGRVRTANKFSDRTLDLDLLLYSDVICDPESSAKTVVLPHPEIVEQAYVLQPLTDLAAELVHPGFGSTLSELCQTLKTASPEKFQTLTKVTLPGGA